MEFLFESGPDYLPWILRCEGWCRSGGIQNLKASNGSISKDFQVGINMNE